MYINKVLCYRLTYCIYQWRTEGGLGFSNPPPLEISKDLQNCAKLTDLRELLKIAEFRKPTPQDVRKKGH